MWRPIETAPVGVEDLEFLAWDGSSFYVLYSDITMDSGEGIEFFNGDVFILATHWMPLPEPPK